MNVLHVSPVVFGSDGVVGGGERYAMELARAMSKLANTRLVAFGTPRAERSEALEIRIHRPWAYVGTKHLGPVSPALLRDIAWADVVHCHQLHTFLADQCVFVARLLGKGVFLTDHAGGDRHFNHRLHTVDRATGLLLVSRHNATAFAAHTHKIEIIHGGADPLRFAPRSGERRRSALFVGRLIPYKGAHLLVDGVRNNTEIRLAGPRYHEDYYHLLEEKSRGKNVHFLGPLMGEALIEEYSLTGVSVLPSVDVDVYGKRYPKSEILGLVLLEAMACQAPVVCSRLGGMPELVADGETGLLVPPGDSTALGDAVESLLDDTPRARRMGEAGRARVLEQFTWDHVARRCLAAYERLGKVSVPTRSAGAPGRAP